VDDHAQFMPLEIDAVIAKAKAKEGLPRAFQLSKMLRVALEHLLNEEEGLDKAARQKIESQKRTIVEGTQEWDILYRKYYADEVKKLGIS